MICFEEEKKDMKFLQAEYYYRFLHQSKLKQNSNNKFNFDVSLMCTTLATAD